MPSVKEISLCLLLTLAVGALFMEKKDLVDMGLLGTTTVAESKRGQGDEGDMIGKIPCTANTTGTDLVYQNPASFQQANNGSNSPFVVLDRTDFLRESRLWRDNCFTVEHVCFSTGRWWYKTDNVPNNARQPNITFMAHKETNYKLAYPKTIPIRKATDAVKNFTCPYSPIPNHMILNSVYNEMLGEFYDRIQVGLNYLLHEGHKDMQAVLDSTQMYLQLWNFDRKLMDSHHAFLSPYLSHPLLDFKALLQYTSCMCVERLAMCGYKKGRYSPENQDILRGPGLDHERFMRPGFNKHDPLLYRRAYNFLQERVIQNNPLVQEDIARFRKVFLMKSGVKDSFDAWKIVGFAQRSSRRKWLNIDANMRMCNDKFRLDRIVCMVVNVENPEFTPSLHTVVHGSLDALIGIHGAQMTDALWMKPGSTVVEMLSYLPPTVSHGAWTRWVNYATPLGVIYMGTDLYHVGLPLQWNSVPQCADKKGEAFVDCVRKHQWDGRDFDVDPKDIEDAIRNFVIERPDLCDKQNELAGEERFVLYNVQCDDGKGKGKEIHSFYWPKNLESVKKYQKYPGSDEDK